jgi:hypothetical protein
LIPIVAMATAKSVASPHDRGFGVTDPLDVSYDSAAHKRHGVPWTVLRASDPIVRCQPAGIGKLPQGFLFEGAASHAAA